MKAPDSYIQPKVSPCRARARGRNRNRGQGSVCRSRNLRFAPDGAAINTYPAAFSLIEMLVVISIIVLMLGMVWPVVGVLKKAAGTQSATNTVGIAVETARFIDSEEAAVDKPITVTGAPINPNFSVKWSGTAALFTASGQVRFLECDQTAEATTTASGDNSDYLGDPNNAVTRYGYTDVSSRNYVTLPSARGIVGIIRTSTGIHLITPPFAVRFNKAGQLVAGTADADYVYYDANYDGKYIVNDGRPSSYVMDKSALWNGDRYRVAFEKIETVIGIVLFDPSGIDLGGDSSNGYVKSGPNSPQSTIMSTGKIMLFNRYTGAPIEKLSHD